MENLQNQREETFPQTPPLKSRYAHDEDERDHEKISMSKIETYRTIDFETQ